MPRKVYAEDRRSLPGRASNYIKHFEADVQAGDRLVILCRVSIGHNASHLKHQEDAIRAAAAACGATVVAVVRYVGAGYDHPYRETGWYGAVVTAARLARKHGAKLVATETDRLIRNAAYHSVRWPDAQAREDDLRYLEQCTANVVLVTLTHPDATAREARAAQTKRGQRATGHKGGRPRPKKPGDKKRRHEKLGAAARWLRCCGDTVAEVAEALDVPWSTAKRWANE